MSNPKDTKNMNDHSRIEPIKKPITKSIVKTLKLSERLALEKKNITTISYKPRDPDFKPKALTKSIALTTSTTSNTKNFSSKNNESSRYKPNANNPNPNKPNNTFSNKTSYKSNNKPNNQIGEDTFKINKPAEHHAKNQKNNDQSQQHNASAIIKSPRNIDNAPKPRASNAGESAQTKHTSAKFDRAPKSYSNSGAKKEQASKANYPSKHAPHNKTQNSSKNSTQKSPKVQTQQQKYAKYPRFVAAEILNAIYEGRSLSECFTPLTEYLTEQDQRFVQFLLYGALRQYEALNDQLNQLMSKPIKNSEKIVHGMLILAIFETIHMRTKDYACVNLWVETIKQQQKDWAVALTNGILRTVLRQGLPPVNTHLGTQNLPKWLWAKFIQDFPEHAQNMARYYMQHPIMTLRVNLAQTSREDYLGLLLNANISAYPHQFIATAIVLESPIAVTALPFFEQGMCSIQDASAQFAAILLNPQKNELIMDACAAPGGKTGHILEIQSDIDLIALDISNARLARVVDNIDRIFSKKMQNIEYIARDILDYKPDVQSDLPTKFDAILLDAPCSGTGILHRHPDIKRLRLASDIPVLVALQAKILDHCWGLLKPGGRLLYTTCSVLKDENERQMQLFFDTHPDAIELPIDAQFGLPQHHGLQVLPTHIDVADNNNDADIKDITDSEVTHTKAKDSNNIEKIEIIEIIEKMDGFYYCMLQKK